MKINEKLCFPIVMDITANADGAAIVKTILAMAKTLKLMSVAEGVERFEEMTFLAENGCDEIQGYYFSRPVPLDEFTELLRSGKKLCHPKAAISC